MVNQFVAYDCNLKNLFQLKLAEVENKDQIEHIITMMCVLQIPASTEFLSRIWNISEDKLLDLANTEMKFIVWSFKKRSRSVPSEEEKKEYEESDDGDDTVYLCLKCVHSWAPENPADYHNKIVRALRKQPVEHYSLFCIWYHISECDEDYTKDYLEEVANKIDLNGIHDDILGDDSDDKTKTTTFFDLYGLLFDTKTIYKFIEFHKGFEFLINELGIVISSHQTDIIEKERSQILNFRNILYLIEHTIKHEKLNYSDFCAQLRGRIIGEEENSLMHKIRQDITNQKGTYFKGFQNSLRENAKIQTIMKMPFSTTKTCLFSDNRRTAVLTDCGLIYIIWVIDFEIISVVSSTFPELGWCQFFAQAVEFEGEDAEEDIEEDEYIFTAGNDPYIRKWDLASQREIAHYQCHKTECTTLICFYEFLISTGKDKRIVKFNIDKEKIERVYKSKENIASIRILENHDDRDASKFLISNQTGYLELLDFDLELITSLSSPSNERIVSLINHSLSEFLSFTKDGQITVYDQETLSVIKEQSILNLKSDDYLDIILIRSKEYILFTLEKQKMDFFTCATFKKTDSWDYFFDEDLNHCEQNFEGSKIIIWDKGGYVTLFNFLKNADPNSKGMQLSCNRRNDPVASLETTSGLDQDKIVSCSNDRDLRIWKKNDGSFLKKYDLSSFTNESITSMRLGKDQNMLFLGSKDMNVYLIDIGRGKLWVVYEGHWNKVNIIYTIPERDILITVSESNIKVWDLEYDECIKNMNDHESSIVHVSQYEQKSQQHILTIGSNFEMRMWNYETGEDSKEHKLNIDKGSKTRTVMCACTFDHKIYLATNKNIVVYSMDENEIKHEFKSYNNEEVINMYAYKTKDQEYLIVTTRTSSILYTVDHDGLEMHVEKVCGYYLNSKKRQARRGTNTKYNTNFRFYFTSCKICPLKAISKTEIKKLVAENTFTGLLDNTEGVGFDQTKEDQEGTDAMIKEIIKEPKNEEGYVQLTTRVIDSAREKIRQEVLLVCLGDSKGYLHFNHLYV